MRNLTFVFLCLFLVGCSGQNTKFWESVGITVDPKKPTADGGPPPACRVIPTRYFYSGGDWRSADFWKKLCPNEYATLLQNKRVAEQNKIEGKKKECKNMGFEDNTEYMSQCILQLTEIERLEKLVMQAKSNADRAAASQRLFQLGQTLSNMGNSILNTGSSSSGSDSYTFNEICYYSCNGELFAKNIKKTRICPLNIQRNGSTCFRK